MKLSRYLKIYVCAFLTLLVLAFFNAVIDPYGLYLFVKIDGLNWPKPEMVKSVKLHKSYRVAQLEPEAVILGTSRSAFGIDPENGAWQNTFQGHYNFALAGANMFVTRRFLEHSQTLYPLKQVVFGLDFFTFNAYRQQAPDYRDDFLIIKDNGNLNRHFDMKILAASLLSTNALQATYKTIDSKKKFPLMISENGMFIGGSLRKDKLKQKFSNTENLYFRYVYLTGKKREYGFVNLETGASSLKEFRNIVIYCREHQIDLKLFISPAHARHLEIVRVLGIWPLFEQWKRELVRILLEENYASSLWDFSGYNSITTVDIRTDGVHYYRDSTHYLPIVGDMILSRIFHYNEVNVPTDFGRVLNSGNVEENLLIIQTEQEKYRLNYPKQVKEIESMAEKYDFDAQDLILRKDGIHSKARWFRSEFRNNPVSNALRDYERGVPLAKLYIDHHISKERFNNWKKIYDHQI